MKKLMVLVLVMVFLATAVNSLTEANNQYWSLDYNDYDSSNDNGNITFSLGNSPVVTTDGIWGNATDLERGDSDYLVTSDVNGGNISAISFWIKAESWTSASGLFTISDSTATNYYWLFFGGEGITTQGAWGGVQKQEKFDYSEGSINTGQDYCFVWQHGDGLGTDLFLDNTSIGTDTAMQHNLTQTFDELVIGSYFGDNHYADGIFDEIAIWHKRLSQAEIEEICSQNPFNALVSTPPTITDVLPVNNTYALATQFFNATFTSTNDATTNITFYVNNAVNQSVNNTANATTQNFNLTLDGEKSLTWKFQACDSIGCTNTSQYTIKADTIAPEMLYSFTNGSSYYKTNVTGWFNFSDGLLLHSYNISIDGVNIQGNNSIGTNSLNVTLNYDASNLYVGLHTLNVTVADGHTDEVLKGDYTFNNGLFNDYARYEFTAPYNYGSIKIKQKDSSIFDSWTSQKLTDRYVFSFEPGSKKESYTFTVEALSKIHIADVPGSKYGKWLIYDNHWLDFMPYKDVSIVRISDNVVEVTVSDAGINSLDKLSFNSIGDLNVVTRMFYFFTNNASYSFTPLVLSYESQAMTLNLTRYGLNSTGASLVWNGTTKTVSKTSHPGSDLYTSTFTTQPFDVDSNITFVWYYNLTSNVSVESGNVTDYQYVSNIGIDNCSTFGLRGINFTVINSSDDSVMNSSAGGYFQIYIDSISNYKSHNITWSYDEIHSVCIYPNQSSFNLTGQAEFIVGSNTKTYYINDLLVSNATQNINIYFEPGTTLVTFSVTDENDNDIEGAFITVLRYDFATNTYLVSEILETDSAGNALGNLVLNTNWYKFIVTYNGIIYLETSPTKIISTTYSFQIVLGSDYFESYTSLGSISCNVAFNNNSKIFTYTASDGSGGSNTYCLDVWKKTLNSNSVINSSCASGSSVVINVGISEATGDNTYTGMGNVWIDGLKFLCADKSSSYNTGFKKFGQEGLFATFMICLTLIMIGIWSPIIAIALMILGIIVSVIIGFFMLTWSMIITFVILAIIAMMRLNQK